jgi:NitT/TauT family transport system substrate-binding protein
MEDNMYLSRSVRMTSWLLVVVILVFPLITGMGSRDKTQTESNTQQDVVSSEPTKSDTTVQSAEPRTAMSFRLKWIIYSSFAHHFVAKEKGLYDAEGLDVNIQPGGAGIDPIKLVAAGDDLIGLGSPAQILLAREKGIPVIAVGEEYVRNGSVSLSLKGSRITSPQDFVGKKVAWIPGSDTGTIYQAMMAKLEIDRSEITEVPGGFDLTPFLNGAVDVTTIAYNTNQPIQAMMAGFEVNIIDPVDYGIKTGGNIFFTTEEKLARHRQTIKSFLRASIKGIYIAQQMPNSEVVDIVLKYNPKLKKNTELEIWEATKRLLLEHSPAKMGFLYREKWEADADVFNKYGGLKNPPPINECFTNSIIEEIHSEGKIF